MRFAIFPILGPLLAALTFIVFSGSAFEPDLPNRIARAIPFIYVIGIIPALLTLVVDWLLRNVSWRPLYTGVAGYVLSYTLLLPPLELKSSDTKGLLLFGVGGLVAGAICSWLSSATSRMMNRQGAA
jgi:hypothetical protein